MTRDTFKAKGTPPSAPVGVEGFDKWFDEYRKTNYNDTMLAEAAWKAALTQQPVAVDDEMVERAINAYFAAQNMLVAKDGKLAKAMKAALTAALSTQPQGDKV